MTDRRETPRKPNRAGGRPGRAGPGAPAGGSKPARSGPPSKKRRDAPANWQVGERIAKYLARAGIASRREAEAMIERREVRVDGHVLTTPAYKVTGREDIRVRGDRVSAPETVRVWRYHKPAGLITTTQDPEGRRTIFDELPKTLPRTITIGRLDLTTEGLLLLTNSGELARALELPRAGFRRTYRARAHGHVNQSDLTQLKSGVSLDDGTRYTSIEATLERETGTNNWITVELNEGKNREVRKALEHVGLQVNRLIRTAYGPFELGAMRPGVVEEIPAAVLISTLSGQVPDSCLPQANRTRPAGGKSAPGRRSPAGAKPSSDGQYSRPGGKSHTGGPSQAGGKPPAAGKPRSGGKPPAGARLHRRDR